jgi:hypothetical protein
MDALLRETKTRSFHAAKFAVQQIATDPWGEPEIDLISVCTGSGMLYIVTKRGRVIGKGMHFETAIADAEIDA